MHACFALAFVRIRIPRLAVQLEEHARLREQVCARLGQLCEHVTAGAIGGSTEQESVVQRPLQCVSSVAIADE